ncbi:hypothetical protein PENSPDRAFT_581799 [Peniophora sp. CONT]|nr:hypothetical protein PENSPDRAFT_581799 [Peniophora sp. CONT]
MLGPDRTVPSRSRRQREPWTRERLLHARAIALGAVIEPTTRASYTSALNSWLTFCRLNQFPTQPDAESLSLYVAYECHYIQPKSVEFYLSGICNQLEMYHPDVRTLRRHPLVTRTLAGCKKQFSKPTQRKAALTVTDLESAAAQLSNSYDDRLFLAMLYTGFFGLHRLAELTDHDKPAFRSHRKTIMRSSVCIENDVYVYLLPGHKADRFYEGNTGMPGEWIQALGRWSSDAFQMYIRKHPVVLHGLLQARRAGEPGVPGAAVGAA